MADCSIDDIVDSIQHMGPVPPADSVADALCRVVSSLYPDISCGNLTGFSISWDGHSHFTVIKLNGATSVTEAYNI